MVECLEVMPDAGVVGKCQQWVWMTDGCHRTEASLPAFCVPMNKV